MRRAVGLSVALVVIFCSGVFVGTVIPEQYLVPDDRIYTVEECIAWSEVAAQRHYQAIWEGEDEAFHLHWARVHNSSKYWLEGRK